MEKRKYHILAILAGLLALIWVIMLWPGEKEEDVAKATKGARQRRPAVTEKVKEGSAPVKVLAGPIQLEAETKDLFRALYPKVTAQAARPKGMRERIPPPPVGQTVAKAPQPPAPPAMPGATPTAPPRPGEARAGPPPPGSGPGMPGAPVVAGADDLKGLAFLGLVRTGVRQTVFLSKDQEILAVRKGDLLLDKYRVEKVTEESVVLISPKKDEITITFVEGEPLKVTTKRQS